MPTRVKNHLDPAIEVTGLSVRFPRAASSVLRDVGLAMNGGEVVGLRGASGAGKTSLLHTIAGLIPWFTPAVIGGEIAIGGESMVELDPGQRAHLMTTCLDRPEAQLFLATPRQEIDAARRRFGSGSFADAAVEGLGLGQHLDRRVTELSSGERQRVALAVALAGAPRPVLLDEPTAHLDGAGASVLVDLLGRATRLGTPILLTEQAGWRLDGAVSRWFGIDDGRLEIADRPEPPRLAPPTHAPGSRVALSCSALSVSRGDRTLIQDIGLDLHEGEVIALTGPNGSGKSTLARVLAGLTPPSAGEVEVERRIGLMLPEAELQLFASTVAGEVSAAGTRHEERARVLRLHRLDHLAARAPWTLSRGEQQRLVHAALDLLRPEVMIVDEPAQGLDGDDIAAFHELVRRRSAKGRAYLVITHRPELAAAAHRRFEVRAGRLEEVSP